MPGLIDLAPSGGFGPVRFSADKEILAIAVGTGNDPACSQAILSDRANADGGF